MFPTSLRANRVDFEGWRIACRSLLWPIVAHDRIVGGGQPIEGDRSDAFGQEQALRLLISTP
jgi:hypothetical protein